MSAYPIFDKFDKLSGEKKFLEIGQNLTMLDPKNISLLHTQYLEDSTAPALSQTQVAQNLPLRPFWDPQEVTDSVVLEKFEMGHPPSQKRETVEAVEA